MKKHFLFILLNLCLIANNTNAQNLDESQNVVVQVTLQPIGTAAKLPRNRETDVMPSKNIKFDFKNLYLKPVVTPKTKVVVTPKTKVVVTPKTKEVITPKTKEVNKVGRFGLNHPLLGTWINVDSKTNSITKIIISNTSSIQVFGKCSPQDCDWGKRPLTLKGNNFTALFEFSFKRSTITLSYNNDQLTANFSDVYTDSRPKRVYSNLFKKNQQPFIVTPSVFRLKDLSLIKPAATGKSKAPEGPDNDYPLNLWDELVVDDQVEFRRPQDISNISMNIFADKNKNSGVYYMIPADYHLRWEARAQTEKGYDFRILYGTQKAAESAENVTSSGAVRMSATLTAGINNQEKAFIKSLLKAAKPDFTDLKFIPLRENPEFTFQSMLGEQFNIPENKITVETSTDLSNDIKISWQTDADTKEFIQTALTSREGIAASVILKPADETIPNQQIPAFINLADVSTLGKINISRSNWRNTKWQNKTPYPLQLNYFHVLKREKDGIKPIVYSWSAGDAIVPSQAKVSFDGQSVPTWLDNTESVMWVEYGIMDCPECDEKVMDAVTGGVSSSKAQMIKFTIPPVVFDSLNAAYFLINIRSKQVDPKGVELADLGSIKITKEGDKDFSAGPLFVPSNGQLEFQYKITLATIDGDFYEAKDWIQTFDKEVLLGKTKLRDIFRGIVPGIE